ncbi:MAG TPA: hypothetical protein VME43_17675 [Bryobacteraceae bacterium]|nr:hypothetical protein [Bryobacteraceae bacterium]
MMQMVQLAIADGAYAQAVREALARTCACTVETVAQPDLERQCVVVLDESAFEGLSLPVSNPERVVLITRKDPRLLEQAWEAGIVSVVSDEDPLSTVLLAIMAASLRVGIPHSSSLVSGISPNPSAVPAALAPPNRTSGPKRCKIQ